MAAIMSGPQCVDTELFHDVFSSIYLFYMVDRQEMTSLLLLRAILNSGSFQYFHGVPAVHICFDLMVPQTQKYGPEKDARFLATSLS